MTWSFSRVGSYLDCPYRFLLKYILCEPEEKEMFFSSYGSFMHGLIADNLTGKCGADELFVRYLEGFDKNVRGEPPNQSIYGRYYTDGMRYCSDYGWRGFPYRDIEAVERRVFFNVYGRKFVGVIDCLAREGDDLILIDHKSRTLQPRSGKNPPLKRDEELDEYYRQLYLYCKPVKEIYGRFPKRLEFNCFRSGVWISEPFDEVKYWETLQFFANVILEISARDDWPHIDNPFVCRNLCEMNGKCEYCEE